MKRFNQKKKRHDYILFFARGYGYTYKDWIEQIECKKYDWHKILR